MSRFALIAVALSLLCAQVSVADESVEVTEASLLQQFAMDPFGESKGHNPVFYNQLSGIINRFGKPISEKQVKLGDRTSDAVLTSHALQYDGLTFGIIESEDKKHSWLETIDVSGNAYALKYGVAIGSTYSEITSLFRLRLPEYRAKGTPLHLYTKIEGYRADFKDQSGKPRRVFAEIDITFYFDVEDRIERVVLENYGD